MIQILLNSKKFVKFIKFLKSYNKNNLQHYFIEQYIKHLFIFLVRNELGTEVLFKHLR